MIVGPRYKICKRLGNGVFDQCQTQKFTLSEARKKTTFSGKRPRPLSDYGKQLLEKQRVRFTYGISEKQLVRYVKEATSKKDADVTAILLSTLEYRLDNVVYRLGLASTRRAARQMVSHGHILANGKKVTVPSYTVKVNEKISIKDKSAKGGLFTDLQERLAEYKIPTWLTFNVKKMEGEVKGEPTKDNTEVMFNLGVVMEYYSR